jgi:hypothetical protein
MLIAGTLRQEFCTKLYGIYTLTKGETMNFGIAALCLVRLTLHAGVITQVKIMFVTTVVKKHVELPAIVYTCA